MTPTLIRGGRAVAYAMPVPVASLNACFAEAAWWLRAPLRELVVDVGPGTAGYLVITTTTALVEWRAWQEPSQ
jgi:hypothetical protein